MPVCPLDFRYGREMMKAIFDENNRLQLMLDVEAALARAHAKVGNIPQADADVITSKASIEIVKRSRVIQIEAEINHDIMSVVKAMAEQCGESGSYIHLGATSNDIIDTTTALQFKAAVEILRDDLTLLAHTLADLAEEHKDTIMVGRTHGQFAIPLTFGMKVATYALETHRHLQRLNELAPRICVGKMSGAVGTGAALGEHALNIQKLVMNNLGLQYEPASLQVIGRDRYSEFVALMAIIASSLEKFAVEVRNLQRSEIGEVSEAFDLSKQVGSSTMANKKNPITSENICGLARIVRGFLVPTLENMPLWHERDLTNSSAERFIIPHVCVLTDDLLAKTNNVFTNLSVNKENMMRNLESTRGHVMAEPVMMALTKQGMGRQEAHELVRQVSLSAEAGGKTLKEAIMENPGLSKMFPPEELDRVLDPKNYVGRASEIVDEVVATIRAG